MECAYGYFHCSNYSDIYIVDKNFKTKKNGEEGIVQLLSLLPTSYPGHNILTEDLGVIVGENNCKCGRLGKYFNITGRIKNQKIEDA